ncbi:MAG: zinc-binding alcohol dehydrogenase family protein [Parachlamydiales bacterium]
MKAAYLTTLFKNAQEIDIPCIERPTPAPKQGEVLIQIVSSGINPSDVRATMGYFPNAQLPRVPGRDFSGIVMDGSKTWKGKHVWGTGGAVGIQSDGTHAEYAIISEAGLAEIPSSLSLLQAGAQPLPFITAYYGLVSRARIKPEEKVLVIGAMGQVGRAAMTICSWKKARPIALVRTQEDVLAANQLGWEAYSEIPNNLSVDLILNSIGSLHWDQQIHSLNSQGRMIVIAALPNQRETSINLFEIYRKNQEIIGINTLDLDSAFNATLLNEMREGFESGALVPLESGMIFSLKDISEAYKVVLQGSNGKRVLLNISSP